MSRWTWMECVIWVSAIAAMSSISRPQSDFLVSDQSHLGNTQLPSLVASPECDEPDPEPLRLSLINIQQKLDSQSACESFRRRDQQDLKGSSEHFGFIARLIESQWDITTASTRS